MSSNLTFIEKLSVLHKEHADTEKQIQSYDEQIQQNKQQINILEQKIAFMQEFSQLLEKEDFSENDLQRLSKKSDSDEMKTLINSISENRSPENKVTVRQKLATLIETKNDFIQQAKQRCTTYHKYSLTDSANLTDINLDIITIERKILMNEVEQQKSSQQQKKVGKQNLEKAIAPSRYRSASFQPACKKPEATPLNQTRTLGMA